MTKTLEELLLIGGHANSLGKTNEVITMVLQNKVLLAELYECMLNGDTWVRMRAADAFEKICREHPDWIEPYVDKLQSQLSGADQQASIKWHLAQIYPQITLTTKQKEFALTWLKSQVATINVDWIVAANCLKSLLFFAKRGDIPQTELEKLLHIQQNHPSKSVVKKATKILAELS